MTLEQVAEQQQDEAAMEALQSNHAEHAAEMKRLRRHVAGKLASEINHRLGGERLSTWDVLDLVQRWHEEMAREFGRSCLLSGRSRGGRAEHGGLS